MEEKKPDSETKFTNLFSDDVLRKSSGGRFLGFIRREIERSVDDGIDAEFDNPNSTVGKFITDTTLVLDDIKTDVKVIRKDTQSLVKSFEKLEKAMKNAAFGGGGGSNFFNDALSYAPLAFGAATGGYLLYKQDRKLDIGAITVGRAAQRGFGSLAASMNNNMVTVGKNIYRNPMTVKFIKGLEKSAKYSKYAGVVALIILNATEPVMAYLEDKPAEVVRTEIVGAIANVLGTIIGIKVGAVAGGAVGSLFAGLGAAPGVAIGMVLGGVIGYLSGEGLEYLAENLWMTIIEGGDMERTIDEFSKKQSRNISKLPGRGIRADMLQKFEPDTTPARGRGNPKNRTSDSNSTPEIQPTVVTPKTGRLAQKTQAQPETKTVMIPNGQQAINELEKSYYDQNVGGIENGTGKYLTDQLNQMPGMYGGGFSGRTATETSPYGAGIYGGIGSEKGRRLYSGDGIITPDIGQMDEQLWNDLSAGKTIVSSSTLSKFTDQQLQDLYIKKSTTYGGDRHMSATTYQSSIPQEEIDKNLTTNKSYRKAVLSGVASGEGGNDYGAINYKAGGGSTKDFSKHPFAGKKGVTAAGRYQILASNYEKYGKQIGITDFSEDSQDAVAWQMASDVYKRQTGRSLDQDAQNPKNLPMIFNTLSSDWHGLRGNGGQTKAMDWANKELAKGTMSPDQFAKLSPDEQSKLRSETRQKIMDQKKNTFNQIAFGVNGAPQSTGGGRVTQDQARVAGTRKGALQPNLVKDMNNVAAKNGVDIRVVSGGQRMPGAPGATSGTHNHDQGFAGDVEISMLDENGKKIILDSNNPAHRQKLAQITKDFAQLGHSVGLGYQYMSGNKMHVGSGPHGSQRPWGNGETRAGMPGWALSAFEEGVELKNKKVPFGDFTPKEQMTLKSLVTSYAANQTNQAQSQAPALMPNNGPTIDAAYIDSRIKQAVGDIDKKLDTMKNETANVPSTGKNTNSGGPNPERFGGTHPDKPSSFKENNAKQRLPDWVFNPTIYSPIQPAVE